MASLLAIRTNAERASFILPALVAADLLAVHTALNPTTPAALFRDRPPLAAFIPRGSRIYVSDYSISLPNATVRQPAGAPYALAKAPAGFSESEALSLAAAWYLNPPIAGRFGYRGSFDLDILDFYRAPLKKSVQEFVTSRDPAYVMDRLARASVSHVVTMDPPSLWNSLPLIAEEKRFFEAPVRVYAVPEPWPSVRFETPSGARAEGAPVVIHHDDGNIEVESVTTEPSLLVAAVANDRGWRATVDGAPVAVVDNSLAFVSVPVSAGRHHVSLFYRPPFLRIGILISILALSIAAMLSRFGSAGRRDA
jgi:hypothetical protein